MVDIKESKLHHAAAKPYQLHGHFSPYRLQWDAQRVPPLAGNRWQGRLAFVSPPLSPHRAAGGAGGGGAGGGVGPLPGEDASDGLAEGELELSVYTEVLVSEEAAAVGLSSSWSSSSWSFSSSSTTIVALCPGGDCWELCSESEPPSSSVESSCCPELTCGAGSLPFAASIRDPLLLCELCRGLRSPDERRLLPPSEWCGPRGVCSEPPSLSIESPCCLELVCKALSLPLAASTRDLLLLRELCRESRSLPSGPSARDLLLSLEWSELAPEPD